MQGAHMNGNEMFPLWAAAILAANVAGVDASLLNWASAIFIALRVAFNHIYIGHTTRAASVIRTVVFGSSVAIPMALFFKSASIVTAR
ncbi:hypothetical protein AX17_003200 [Amanita inopinata Kibby_2008]|nr:hypothetical protein AX17_003200 [Amanita inopinata Kibby_2008]